MKTRNKPASQTYYPKQPTSCSKSKAETCEEGIKNANRSIKMTNKFSESTDIDMMKQTVELSTDSNTSSIMMENISHFKAFSKFKETL